MVREYRSLAAFLDDGRAALEKGPVALMFVEDEAALPETVAHHAAQGFAAIVALVGPGVRAGPAALAPPEGSRCAVHVLPHDIFAERAVPDAVSRIIAAAAPGIWLYWGYNAEFLFYPFCETRPVTALLAFHAEERREAMPVHVVDLYAPDLATHPSGVDLARAHFDRTGYYAEARRDPANHNHPKERQLELFGGLRWRFEEHVPPHRRQIGRTGIFRARKGLTMRPDYLMSDEEMNTYSCPWHHNLSAATASFRAAKALRDNPSSSRAIGSFMWHGSEPFRWSSDQLMRLGLMEPGQWF